MSEARSIELRPGDGRCVNRAVDEAGRAFRRRREAPAPTRGEPVRRRGLGLRDHKADLAAEGGAEKETGGGRESGSGSWRAYMRRATNTVSDSRDRRLAQGIRFEVDADADTGP